MDSNSIIAHSQYKSLNFVQFSSIPNWSTFAILINRLDYRDEFKLVKIGKLIKRVKDSIKIQDDTVYKRVTIRVQGRGVVQRNEEVGKNIGTKSQFRVSVGQFIMSKIDARNGAFGIVPKELDGAAVTQDFLTYSFNTALLIPEFFVLLTTTKQFYDLCQRASSGTTNRQRIDEQLFLNFEIPLPSLELQKNLFELYNNRVLEAEKQECEALNLESSIDTRIIESLGIKHDLKSKSKGFNIITFKDITRWGVDTNLNSANPSNIIKSNKFSNVSLKKVVNINPSVSFGNVTEVSFVPMEAVSDESGEVTKKRIGKVENSKGYTKFKNGDLIWAKITPCMENGKSAVVRELYNGYGYGSTEFYVIRPIQENILNDYLHILLRLNLLREKATNYFSGSAGQQRVPRFFLEELTIPLPSIEEQNRIVNSIKKIRVEIKTLREKSYFNRNKALETFEKALFK